MKKVLRGGLLAILFVGMSGYSSNNCMDSKSTLTIKEDPERVGRDCVKEADEGAELVEKAFPALTSGTVSMVWMDLYLSCKY